MLQIILIIIAIIILVVLLVAAFMKKDSSIVSEIEINKPQRVVFDFVKILRNQEKYSKWVMADPNSKIEYKGTDGTVGFISSWKSEMKNVGVGEQEIINIVDGERYDVEIRFEKPFKGISKAIITTEFVDANKTKVTTTFNSHTPFPMNLMSALMKNMLQKDMDINSKAIKKVLEEGR